MQHAYAKHVLHRSDFNLIYQRSSRGLPFGRSNGCSWRTSSHWTPCFGSKTYTVARPNMHARLLVNKALRDLKKRHIFMQMRRPSTTPRSARLDPRAHFTHQKRINCRCTDPRPISLRLNQQRSNFRSQPSGCAAGCSGKYIEAVVTYGDCVGRSTELL